MTDKDISFFQSLAEQILLYCANARINNREVLARIERDRKSFQLHKETEKEKQISQLWTAEELRILPNLKDLKFRITQNGLYQYRYRRNGYDKQFTSKNKDVARKKAFLFIKELKAILNKNGGVEHGITFSYVAKEWLSLKKNHADGETWRGYEAVFRLHIEPIFGKRNIKKILPVDLQPFFDKLFVQAGRTCEKAKTIVNGVFDYAVANRFCPTNPMDGVIVEKHVRKKGSAISDEQINELKQNARNEVGLAGLIILYSGIRGAELESLQFNWDEGTFTVNNAKLKKHQKVDVRNLTRTVPIFPGLFALKSRIELDSAWRIPSKNLTYRFRNFFDNFTPKELRHTFITKAREAGIDNELVNLWTGHLPGTNVTANVYTHFSLDYQKKEAKKLDNY